MNTLTIAWDVDGTLITLEGTPRYDVIQLFKLLESFGCRMIIWSGGGIDYAQRWAEKLGLKAMILVKGSEWKEGVDLAVDDFPSGEERVVVGGVEFPSSAKSTLGRLLLKV